MRANKDSSDIFMIYCRESVYTLSEMRQHRKIPLRDYCGNAIDSTIIYRLEVRFTLIYPPIQRHYH